MADRSTHVVRPPLHNCTLTNHKCTVADGADTSTEFSYPTHETPPVGSCSYG